MRRRADTEEPNPADAEEEDHAEGAAAGLRARLLRPAEPADRGNRPLHDGRGPRAAPLRAPDPRRPRRRTAPLVGSRRRSRHPGSRVLPPLHPRKDPSRRLRALADHRARRPPGNPEHVRRGLQRPARERRLRVVRAPGQLAEPPHPRRLPPDHGVTRRPRPAGRAGPDGLLRPAVRHQVQQQLPAVGERPKPGGHGKISPERCRYRPGLPRHLRERAPLLPRQHPQERRSRTDTPPRIRQPLRSDRQ